MDARLTRRGFVAALTAGSAAAGAAPASAAEAAAKRPSLRPGPAAPVRAMYRDMPYFDFNGAAPAKAQRAKPQDKLETLSADRRWLLGVF